MSWPSDGKPRYIVVETTGYAQVKVGGGARQHITVAVLDRAFCHRVAFKVRSEDCGHSGFAAACAEARALGHEQLAALNDERVAA